MSLSYLLLAALFLPLFPFSTAFMLLLRRLRRPLWRGLLLVLWPQLGLTLVFAAATPPPDWLLTWALFSSALYAFRALTLREVNLWIGFLACSLWPLLWLVLAQETGATLMRLHALGLSAPLLLLALLAGELERRFGAAYTGLPGGLAQRLPRLSGVLVMAVLAGVAAPLFPPFFTMLGLILAAVPAMPVTALALGGIWLLWSWAGARLLQGLVVGPAGTEPAVDLGRAGTWSYVIALTVLTAGGLYLQGGLA